MNENNNNNDIDKFNNDNNKYKNLRYVLEKENLEKLYRKPEEELENFLNGVEPKKASVDGIKLGKISNVSDIQSLVKKLVIETDNSLDEKNMSVRKILEQISDNILPDGMEISEEFIERIPDSEISQKEKILLLMIYALHNIIFDE